MINSEPVTAVWLPSLAVAISGLMLLAGFWTPIAAAVAALFVVFAAFPPLSFTPPVLFDGRFSALLCVTMLVAIALLGPGTVSVDARRFGRRKIIIPSSGTPR